MEDVVTDAPPPSRFSPDDLDNFAAPPPQPTPILVVSPNPSPAPRLLIVLISPTSLALLPHLPSAPPLHASLLLPDLPLQQSHAPIRVYLHNPTGALLAAAHGAVPAHRARAAAKSLVSTLQPEEVLVLDAVRSGAYRGRLAADEPVEGKLETRAARRRGGVGAARGVASLAPPGSVVDGLGAAVMAVDDALESKFERRFELVMDEGTLDSIGLHPDGPVKRMMYWQSVAGLVSPGGILVITSCSRTKDELVQEVENFNQRKLGAMGSEGPLASDAAVFKYLSHVQTYSNVDSSCITTVAFLHK